MDLYKEALATFADLFEQAKKSEPADTNTMILATAGKDARPHARRIGPDFAWRPSGLNFGKPQPTDCTNAPCMKKPPPAGRRFCFILKCSWQRRDATIAIR